MFINEKRKSITLPTRPWSLTHSALNFKLPQCGHQRFRALRGPLSRRSADYHASLQLKKCVLVALFRYFIVPQHCGNLPNEMQIATTTQALLKFVRTYGLKTRQVGQVEKFQWHASKRLCILHIPVMRFCQNRF